MVIEETATLYREMLSVKGWEQKYGEEFIVDHLNRIPQKVCVDYLQYKHLLHVANNQIRSRHFLSLRGAVLMLVSHG